MASRARLIVFALLVSQLALAAATYKLTPNFYDRSCPKASFIIKSKVAKFVRANRGLAAGLMRLHFHDCFVRGCDASVLVDSTDDNLAEKDALLNRFSLRGFEEINEIKAALEDACPGVVSCADILAIVARDAVVAVGGSSWNVLLGRVDGGGSFADDVNGSLPERRDNFKQLVANFAKVGLSAKDVIVLSGGHTIGQLHCGAFNERLYNFQEKNITDPSMDPKFAAFVKRQCPRDRLFDFFSTDTTNGTFDSAYYHNLLTGKGLLESDVALLTDRRGVEFAKRAVRDPNFFKTEFGLAMIRMGNIPPKDPHGWRQHCGVIRPKTTKPYY